MLFRSHRVHLGVGLHLFAGDALERRADPTGRPDEGRQHEQRQDRQTPLECDHHRERDGQGDHVLDDRAQRVGDGLLGAHDVTVEPGLQRAGLCTREEREGELLHVVEERDAQVVNETFTDPGREPPLQQ